MAKQQVITWNSWSDGLSENSYKGWDSQFTHSSKVDITNPFVFSLRNVWSEWMSLPVDYSSFNDIVAGNYGMTAIKALDGWMYKWLFRNLDNSAWIGANSLPEDARYAKYCFPSFDAGNFNEHWVFIGNEGLYIVKYDNSWWIAYPHLTIPPEILAYGRTVWTYLLMNRRLYVALNNVVMEFNMQNKVFTQSFVIDTIPLYERIVGMFQYLDELIVITNNYTVVGNDTTVYRMQSDGSRWDISYKHNIRWEQYLSWVIQNGTIWWVGEKWIYTSQWNETRMFQRGYYEKIYHYKNDMAVKNSSWDLFLLLQVFTWGNYSLHKIDEGITAFSNGYAVKWSQKYIYNMHASLLYYPDTGSITSNVFLDYPGKKLIKQINMQYSMRYTSTNFSRPMGIDVYLVLGNLSRHTEVKIWTVEDPYEDGSKDTENIVVFSGEEIRKALEDAWEKEEVQNVKIKLVLKWWWFRLDPYRWGNCYNNTPIVQSVALFYQDADNANP